MHAPPRRLAGHPASPRHRHPPVDRQRGLVRDERASERLPRAPGLVLSPRLEAIVQLDGDAGPAKPLETPCCLGVRVDGSPRRHVRCPPRRPRRHTAGSSRDGRRAPWSRTASPHGRARQQPRAQRSRRGGRRRPPSRPRRRSSRRRRRRRPRWGWDTRRPPPRSRARARGRGSCRCCSDATVGSGAGRDRRRRRSRRRTASLPPPAPPRRSPRRRHRRPGSGSRPGTRAPRSFRRPRA